MRISLSDITDLSGTCHLNPIMPLKYFMSLKEGVFFLSDITDLGGTRHLNPSVSLKYFMPLKRKGGDTLASPARGLPLQSLKSVMSLKKKHAFFK